MALTYAQSAALMTDPTFIGRVKVAVLKYAGFILAEATNTPQHRARERWAISASLGPDSVAQIVAQPVVMDPNVQINGATTDDPTLQTAVETVLNSTVI